MLSLPGAIATLSVMPQTHHDDFSSGNMHGKRTSSSKSDLQACSQMTVSANGVKLKPCAKASSSVTETAL